MAKKIVGYIRCSTTDQADNGHSIDTQRDQIQSYARLYDLEVIAIYSDEGFTGKNLERPELHKALDMISSGKAHGLLISKLDRLSRNVKDLAMLLDTVFSSSELHSVNEKLDTSTPHGRLAVNIIASVNQWEGEVISERTKHTLALLKKQGKYCGGRGPKYGYRVDSERNVVRDNQEMKVIRKAKSFRSQGFSYSIIAKMLAEKNMLSRNGNMFVSNQIRRMVQ